MSPKSKLGRNPFAGVGADSKPAKRAKKSAGAAKGNAIRKKARQTKERAYRRTKGAGVRHFVEEITHYWIPRIRACAYVRAVKFASKFA